MLTTLPTDAELDARTSALLPRVLDTIALQKMTRRRRRHTLAGAGTATIFASGLLIGATAVALVFNPGGGGGTNAHGQFEPSVFTVDCTGTSPGDGVDQSFSDQATANKAIADLGSFCTTAINTERVQDAISMKAMKLAAAGLACGTIRVPGQPASQWTKEKSAQGNLAVSVSDGTGGPWPASCNASDVTLTVPTYAPASTAVCARAGNWAVVYPAAGANSATVCARHGYTPWSD